MPLWINRRDSPETCKAFIKPMRLLCMGFFLYCIIVFSFFQFTY